MELQQATDSLIAKIGTEILNPVVRLMFAIAFIYFLWGLFKFVKNADNETERDVGKMHMIWGVIGLAIMVAAQGLVALLQDTVQGL